MAHPFSKFFERALRDSTPDENLVIVEAEKLLEKGYRAEEINDVLTTLHKSLVADRDREVLFEAIEDFGHYIEKDDEED